MNTPFEIPVIKADESEELFNDYFETNHFFDDPSDKIVIENKSRILHVRTPEGEQEFGQPIGSIIKVDEHGNPIKDVIKKPKVKVPNIEEKPESKPRKHKPLRIAEDISEEALSKYGHTNYPIDIKPLANNPKFSPLIIDTIKLEDVPDISTLGDMDLNNENDENIKEQTEKLLTVYNLTNEAKPIGHKNSDLAKANSAEQLKANVQHNIAQRILDHAATDPELNRYFDEYTNYLFFYENTLSNHIDPNVGKENSSGILQLTGLKRLDVLKDFGIVDDNVTLKEAMNKKFEYYNYILNKGDVPSMFPKTSDREKIARATILRYLGLSIDYNGVEYESDNSENGYKRYFPNQYTSKISAKEFNDHSTHELIALYKTREIISGWAGTSADTSANSIALQLDVKEAFHIDNAGIDHLKISKAEQAKKDILMRKAFIKSVYAETQDFFKENNITHVELHRGMNFNTYKEGGEFDLPQFIKDNPDFNNIFSASVMDAEDRKLEYADNFAENNFNEDEFNEILYDKFIGDIWNGLNQDLTAISLHDEKINKKDPKALEVEKNGGLYSTQNWQYYDELLSGYKDELYNNWLKDNDKDENDVVAQLKNEYENNLRVQAYEAYEYQEGNTGYDEEIFKDSLRELGDIETNEATMQPLSSWSLDRDATEPFANGTGLNVVLKTSVPISRIFSTSFSGLGCLSEYEMVVLGGTGTMEMRFV